MAGRKSSHWPVPRFAPWSCAGGECEGRSWRCQMCPQILHAAAAYQSQSAYQYDQLQHCIVTNRMTPKCNEQEKEDASASVCFMYLQWTTIGPPSWGLDERMRRKKVSRGPGWVGTPWSGHTVKWNWRTRFISPVPSCKATEEPTEEKAILVFSMTTKKRNCILKKKMKRDGAIHRKWRRTA